MTMFNSAHFDGLQGNEFRKDWPMYEGWVADAATINSVGPTMTTGRYVDGCR
jgi:hypothetical protein